MTSENIEKYYKYFMSIETKWFKVLDIPYKKEMKQIMWDEHIVLYLPIWTERLKSKLTSTEEEFYSCIKNYNRILERSIQIYLTPEDILHEREVSINGHIWESICTRSKREFILNKLY